MSAANVRIHASAEELASSVASLLVEAIAAAQSEGGVPAICLTGGTIADRIHREVARIGASSEVDWSMVEFWWGDERYLETQSPDRNAHQAQAAFLGALGVPAANIHAMPSTGSSCSVDEGARAYAAEFGRRGGRPFLITMLGVGPDGHVASLFPGRTGVEVTDATAIAVVGSPKPPPQRISLTLPALNNAESVWLVASGAEKAAAVREALVDGDLPAGRVRGLVETVWFLDRDAAAELPTTD